MATTFLNRLFAFTLGANKNGVAPGAKMPKPTGAKPPQPTPLPSVGSPSPSTSTLLYDKPPTPRKTLLGQ